MLKRPLSVISITLLLTLIVAQYLNWYICAAMGVIVFIGAIIVTFALKQKNYYKVTVVLLTVACSLGMFVLRNVMYAQPVEKLDGLSSHIIGTVIEEPSYNKGKFQYKLHIDSASGANVSDFKLLITSRSNLSMQEFDMVEGDVVFFTSKYEGHRSENIFIRAYVNAEGNGITVSEGQPSIYQYAINVRKAVRSAINSVMNTDESALITSVLIGDRSAMSVSANDAVRIAGISHITVISGLHLSILMNFLLYVFSALTRSRRIAAAVTLPFVFGIMAVSGFSPSIMRAGITSLIYLVGIICLKRADGLNSLWVAVLVQCLFNPFIVSSVSFLLSTFSTLGMILLQPVIHSKLNRLIRCRVAPVRYAVEAVSISLSAQLMTLPIVITTFGYITPLSVISNLIIDIPTTMILILSAVGVLLLLSGIFSYLGMFVMMIAGLCSKFILIVADIISKPDFSSVYITSFTALVTCAAICCIIMLCTAIKTRHRLRFASLLVTLAISVGALASTVFDSGFVKVTVFDTEGGLAVLLEDGQYRALIGCGETIYAANSISAELTSKGVGSVDMLILPENCDFYSGGATTFLKTISADEIIYTDERLDIMRLEGMKRNANADCTVNMTDSLSAEICDNYIMVTADDIKFVIPNFSTDLPMSDVIIAPAEFISTACKSKYAIISEDAEKVAMTTTRIASLGATPYITGHQQNITVSVQGSKIRFNCEY